MAISINSEPIPLKADKDGVIRVANTRVTLDTVATAFLEGETAEEITQQYSSLDLADVYAVISYYLRQQSQVETYLEQRKIQAQRTHEEINRHSDPQGIRERLLARRGRIGT